MDPDPDLRGFDNIGRLFPLPNVVLFPQVVLPLHIFEPRYRQMTEDALTTDRRIAMVQICPDADWNAEVDPPIEPVACLGKIFDYRRLPDGRFNLLLVGQKRVRIVEEFPKDRLYRTARVEVLEDIEPEVPTEPLRKELIGLFRQFSQRRQNVDPEIATLLEQPLPLGVLTDLLGHYLGLPAAIKQAFLAEVVVENRARRLVSILEQILTHDRTTKTNPDEFPPPFSMN